MAESPLPPFQGFTAKAFAFLKDIDAHQTREWFEVHKSIYEGELKGPMSALVNSLGLSLAARNIELACDPKRALFRIHRDVRFSKDKRPYKTHIGASMTRDGERLAPGLLYVHIDPKGCFVAGGFYQPEPEALQKIRRRMADRPKDIRYLIVALAAAGHKLSDDEDALKRTPRGFEHVEDNDIARLLRMKSLVVRHPLSRKIAGDGDALIRAVTDFAVTVHPLLRFGWAAIAA